MLILPAVLSAGALLLSATVSSSSWQDWPQWRGPQRDGISRETDWSSEGRQIWKREDLGLGYATVAVVDGLVYTTGWVAGEDVLWCLRADTGEVVWEQRYDAEKWDKYHGGGTNTTPSVSAGRVYVLNREGRFASYDAKTGAERWVKDVKKAYEVELPYWGLSASPLVLEEAVILNLGPVVAFDKDTGAELWKSAESYGAAYSTPADATLHDKRVLVVMGGKFLTVLDRTNGKELARTTWETKYDVNAATPLVFEDGRIFVSSGYEHGAGMLRFSGDGIETLWETKGMRNHMATSMLLGEHLYGFDDGILKCFDLEGKEAWRQRGLGKGALSASEDRLILLSEEGELIIAEATPKEFRELSRRAVVPGGECWSMPVLANGRIYSRNSLGHLACTDHRTNDG